MSALPDTQRFTVVERFPVNPPTGSDAMIVINQFQFSLQPPLSPISYANLFATNQYFNAVYIPACDFYSVGQIVTNMVRFIPTSQWTGA